MHFTHWKCFIFTYICYHTYKMLVNVCGRHIKINRKIFLLFFPIRHLFIWMNLVSPNVLLFPITSAGLTNVSNFKQPEPNLFRSFCLKNLNCVSRHSTSVFTARVPMNSTTCFHERQRMRELQVTAVWWTRTANPNIVAKPFIVISRSWHSYNIRLRTAIVVFIGLSSLTNLA
mgnify:CR=1 FL=1